MVVNNFDDESFQLCLCGHLGCSNDIEECTLLDNTAACPCSECDCEECDCEECTCVTTLDEDWDCQP